MGPLDSCGPRSGISAAPPLVGPEQESNINFYYEWLGHARLQMWVDLATFC